MFGTVILLDLSSLRFTLIKSSFTNTNRKNTLSGLKFRKSALQFSQNWALYTVPINKFALWAEK